MKKNSLIFILIIAITLFFGKSYAEDFIYKSYPKMNYLPNLTIKPIDYRSRFIEKYDIKSKWEIKGEREVISNEKYLLTYYPNTGYMRAKIRDDKKLLQYCPAVSEQEAFKIADDYVKTFGFKNVSDFYFEKTRYLGYSGSDESGNRFDELAGYFFLYNKYYKGYRILGNSIEVYVNKCGRIGEINFLDSDISEDGTVEIIPYYNAVNEIGKKWGVDRINDSHFGYLHLGKKYSGKILVPVIMFRVYDGDNQWPADNGSIIKEPVYKVRFINLLKNIPDGILIDKIGKNLERIF